MAAFHLRAWYGKVRRSKLSTRVTVLFAAAFVIPWCAYAWLTISERAEQVQRTERMLAALAAAYGQHATTLISNPGTARVEEELTAFRAALNVPGVTFSLRRSGEQASMPELDGRNGMIVAEASRASDGIVAAASMSEVEALKDWRAGAYAQALALFVRSLFVVGVGWFLGASCAGVKRRNASL